MATSANAAVSEYLDSLPEERRSAIEAVRRVIRRNLPRGYRETVGFGMITYEIPLERYPKTYNKKPLAYVCLAAQKNFCSLYLMAVYQDPAQAAKLKAAFVSERKKADMGKSCVRFRTADDLPLDTIGKMIAGTSVDQFIAQYEASRQ